MRGALAIQGLREPGDSGPIDRNLVVTLPVTVAQNVGYLFDRLSAEGDDPSRIAWIRGSEPFTRHLLWALWMLAAAGAAALAARLRPGMWGGLAGLATAVVPVGIAGTYHLEGWSLAAGLLLAILQVRSAGRAALLWGAVFSLTSLGFIAAAAFLVARRGRGWGAMLIALPIWFALDPGRIVQPGHAVTEAILRFGAVGWPGLGDGPPLRLLLASWTPGFLVAILSLTGGLVRVREEPWRTVGIWTALFWWLPALGGASRPDAVGLAAPLACLLAAVGSEWIAERAVRARVGVAIGLALVLLLPLAKGVFSLRDAERRGRDRIAEMVTRIGRETIDGRLVLRDPAVQLPDSIASFPLPTHVERPEIWDFAYWPGWYGSFTHLLVRARMLRELEEASASRPGARAMLLGLNGHAEAIAVLGDPAVDRGTLVLYRLEPGSPWDPQDRLTLWNQVEGGPLEATFLGNLAAFLADHRQAARAIELNRLALRWDPDSETIWNNLGATLLLLGQPQEAVDALEAGLASHPRSVEIRYTLARAYLEGQLPGRAMVELRKVLSARPNYGPAHYEMARAAMALKQWPLVVQALEAYLANVSDPPNREQVVAALAEARRRARGSQ